MSTYTPIASVTLSSAQASVTFSSIPQTYTDLVLVVNGSTATSMVKYASWAMALRRVLKDNQHSQVQV